MKRLAVVALLTLTACSSNPSGTGVTNEPVDEKPTGSGGRGGGSGGSAKGGSSGTGGSGAGGSAMAGNGAGGNAMAGSSGADANAGTGGGNATDGGSSSDDGGGAAGVGGAMATGYKFGSRPQQYPMGSIKPTGSQAELDAVVKAAYDKWRAAYVTAACDGYVVKTATGTTSASALGNGMVIVAMMAGHEPQAQTIFDGMFAVGRKFPSGISISVPAKHGIRPRPGNEYLPTHTLGPNCSRVFEADSSPSGDLPFAYALTLADKQWGSTGKVNYLDEAKKTANAIKLYDMNPHKLPGLGDWASLPGEGMWTTIARPDYFMVGYFHAYAKASGDMYWMQAIDAVYTKIADVQTRLSAMTGLLPQYLVGSMNPPGGGLLRDANAPHYFGSAGLIPLWLAGDYIAGGDMRAKVALTKITNWLKTKTGGDAGRIVDGYRLNGDAIGTMGTMNFVAPFGAIAIFDAANQAWLDAIWKLMAAAPTVSQAADSANLLGMLIVTGNWWAP